MKSYVLFDSWAGRTQALVTVLKTGPKRSWVRFEEKAFWRSVGHEQWVPNTALSNVFVPQPHRHQGPVAGCPECAREAKESFSELIGTHEKGCDVYVRARLRALAVTEGSQRALASKIGCSPTFLNYILLCKREPAGKVVKFLGLRRSVTYEPINRPRIPCRCPESERRLCLDKERCVKTETL